MAGIASVSKEEEEAYREYYSWRNQFKRLVRSWNRMEKAERRRRRKKRS